MHLDTLPKLFNINRKSIKDLDELIYRIENILYKKGFSKKKPEFEKCDFIYYKKIKKKYSVIYINLHFTDFRKYGIEDILLTFSAEFNYKGDTYTFTANTKNIKIINFEVMAERFYNSIINDLIIEELKRKN